MVEELGDFSSSHVPLNLDASHDDVINLEEGLCSGKISSFMMGCMSVFQQKFKDSLGEGGVRGSVIKVSVNCHGMVLSKLGHVSILEVERKFEVSANGWDTVNDVCPINGATGPGI